MTYIIVETDKGEYGFFFPDGRDRVIYISKKSEVSYPGFSFGVPEEPEVKAASFRTPESVKRLFEMMK